MRNRIALLAGLLCLSVFLTAQQNWQIGWLPEINLNAGLGNDWSLNLKVESRLLQRSGTFDGESGEWQYGLTDVALAGSRKLTGGRNLTGGYLWRQSPEADRHRLFQQFSVVQPFIALRLGHRLAADQTFGGGEPAVWRLRYRLSLELPLNGQEINRREFYLKASNEYLNSWEEGTYDLEVRLGGVLGYVITDANKLETGPDYRLDGFLNGAAGHTLWWKLSWFRKI